MATTGERSFRFGEWTVLPRENRVEKDGQSRTLEPKVLEVLLFLASEPEQVHLRQEILDAVWKDTFVTDEVLTNAVWELRRALDDDAREPRYIRTVPRKGYRLVARVEPLEERGDHKTEDAGSTRHRRAIAAALAGLVLLAAAGAWAWLARERRAGSAWPESIAVLPLDTASDVPAQEAFAVALTDSISAELSASGRYDVPSRASVTDLLSRGVAPPRVSRKLGADAFLEGTLAFAEAGEARLSVQLVDGERDRHLWARIFETDVRDRLGAERRLARRVALELARLADASQGRTASPVTDSAFPGPPLGEEQEITGGWRFRTGGEVWSSPQLADEMVLVGSDDGYLYALDRRSGEERWRFAAGGALRDEVAVRDGQVFLATAGYIRAVGLENGRELWRRRLPVISPPTWIEQGDGMVLGGSYDRRIYALDPADGSTLWSVPTRGENRTAAAVVGGTVAAGTDAGELLLIDATDGAVEVRLDLRSPVAGLAPGPERDVFVATDAGFLYRISLDGVELWRRDLGSRLGVAPLFSDGLLYQGVGDGRLVALDPADGMTLWRFRASDAVGALPRRAGDTLYFGSLDHHLYAVDAVSGAERWRYPTGGWVVSRPLAVDDRIVFAGLDGVVRALPLEGPGVVAAERDWPEPGHPRVIAESEGPKLLWRVEVAEPKRLTTVGDRLLLGTGSGVLALDAMTGERLWRFAASGGVGAEPALVDGRVVFGTLDGIAVALDVRDGRELWRHDLEAATLSAAAAAGGVVYVGDQKGRLHALDLATGARVWWASTDHFINGSPLPLADRIVVGSCDEHVWAFDRSRGSLIWKSHAGECVVSDPVLHEGRVIYGSYSGDILAFDVETGRREWTLATGGYHIWYRPLLLDGTLFVGSGDYHLYAVDAEDGEELWRFRTGNRTLTEVARHGESILFGSHDRRLYAVDRRTGTQRWRLETTRTVSELDVVGDTLYLVADDGWVLAYRLPDAVSGRS